MGLFETSFGISVEFPFVVISLKHEIRCCFIRHRLEKHFSFTNKYSTKLCVSLLNSTVCVHSFKTAVHPGSV
jgi:hypothetical protein